MAVDWNGLTSPFIFYEALQLRVIDVSVKNMQFKITCTNDTRTGEDIGVGTFFNMPPPSNALWSSGDLKRRALQNPDKLQAQLRQALRDFVITHAKLTVKLPETLKLRYEIIPVNPPTYVIVFPICGSDFAYVTRSGVSCTICDYDWQDHANEICPGRLGEYFKSRELHYENAYSIANFQTQLPHWLEAQADAIYKCALEGVANGHKAKTGAGTRSGRVEPEDTVSGDIRNGEASCAGADDTVPEQP